MKELPLITATELMEMKFPLQTQFGQWHWNIKDYTLTLRMETNFTYEIDLEDMTCSAKMLDWIFQIKNKVWATAGVMDGLLIALNYIFYPQHCLCSGGRDNKINPKKVIQEKLNYKPITHEVIHKLIEVYVIIQDLYTDLKYNPQHPVQDKKE